MLFETLPEICIEPTEKTAIVLSHGARTAAVALQLAESLGIKDNLDALQIAAELHDLARKDLPDEIFFCTGKLNDAQWEIVKTHPAKTLEFLGKEFIEKHPIAATLILLHHPEYGERRKNHEPLNPELIPLLTCLIAADKVVSMTEGRPYLMNPKSLQEVTQEISASLEKLYEKYGRSIMIYIDQLPLEAVYTETVKRPVI